MISKTGGFEMKKIKNHELKTIEIPDSLAAAKEIEDVLCLATLVANGEISHTSLEESNQYFEEIHQDCFECKYKDHRLAIMIND